MLAANPMNILMVTNLSCLKQPSNAFFGQEKTYKIIPFPLEHRFTQPGAQQAFPIMADINTHVRQSYIKRYQIIR